MKTCNEVEYKLEKSYYLEEHYKIRGHLAELAAGKTGKYTS